MLNVDDINKLPFIGSRIIKKHNLENLLGSGDIGLLKCASCYVNMSEIHIVCKKNDTHNSPIEGAASKLIEGLAVMGIIVLLFTFNLNIGGPPPVPGLPGRKSKEQRKKEAMRQKLHQKEIEIITIDGCNTCASFWFDGGELERLKLAKIMSKHSGMNNEELEEFNKHIKQNRNELLGVTSKKDKIEMESESKHVKGKIVGKGSASEGSMIYNDKTEKWDYVPKSGK